MIRLNGQEVKITKFPNGESNVDGNSLVNSMRNINVLTYEENETKAQALIKTATINVIELLYEDDSDFIHLMFVKNYLDEKCDSTVQTSLIIPYMPYSRMDRTEGNSVFTLKYICNLINSMNFFEVLIGEAHSDVCLALLNNCIHMSLTEKLTLAVMDDIEFDKNIDYIYYPDATAHRRYSKHITTTNELIGLKKRNFETGKLDSLEIVGNIKEDNSKRKVIMIDDLSSFGGTFQWGAEKLAELGFEEIYLVVGHCENSIFKGKIFGSSLIKTVYTTNSILRKDVEIEQELAQAERMKVCHYMNL